MYIDHSPKLMIKSGNEFVQILKRYSEYSSTEYSWALNANYPINADYPYAKMMIFADKYKLQRFRADTTLNTCIQLNMWVYEKLFYKQVGDYEGPFSALDILAYSEKNRTSVNCAMHALVLTESLLCIGINAKCVQCLPLDPLDVDCHVMTLAYIEEYNRWIALDPSYSTCFFLENGIPCGLKELRECLINDSSYRIQRRVRFPQYQKFNEQWYRAYLAKNLFRFSYTEYPSFFYKEGKKAVAYYLHPMGYGPEVIEETDGIIKRYLKNDAIFWGC